MKQSEDPLQGLEERLAHHAKAFDSLLALTPAREYFGSQIDDGLQPNEQWSRKKQSKEQKRAAKRAKFDPANQKSALDVMQERELKRKRSENPEIEDGGITSEGESPELAKAEKRQKSDLDEAATETKRRAKAEKRKDKRLKKQQRAAGTTAKLEVKKANKWTTSGQVEIEKSDLEDEVDDDESDDGSAEIPAGERSTQVEKLELSGLIDAADAGTPKGDTNEESSSTSTSPRLRSPAFDIATNHSEASSSSSIPSSIPTDLESTPKTSQKPLPPLSSIVSGTSNAASVPSGTSSPKIQLPNIDQEELQERLRKRIEELRARRKADGGDGRPAKSRQELLDQRRRKEEQRKAHKKDLRRQAKEEEAKRQEEQLRGSGSPLSADIFSTSKAQRDNQFSFSRLAFEDGTAADANLTGLSDPRKRKGPQDPRTALEAAQRKQARLAGLDADKRADITEKDMWLNAKKRTHGERVRDDTSLLKKALKRKEKQKSKSEMEWKEREQAVVKGKEAKQKRRESNLQKRREEKGSKGNGKKKPPGGKKKGRPGFEGRFKA